MRPAAASNRFEASYFLRARERLGRRAGLSRSMDWENEPAARPVQALREVRRGAAAWRQEDTRNPCWGQRNQELRYKSNRVDARNRDGQNPRRLQLADDCRADRAVRVAVGTDVQVGRRDRYENRERKRAKSDNRSPQRCPSTLSDPRRHQVAEVSTLGKVRRLSIERQSIHQRCPIARQILPSDPVRRSNDIEPGGGRPSLCRRNEGDRGRALLRRVPIGKWSFARTHNAPSEIASALA